MSNLQQASSRQSCCPAAAAMSTHSNHAGSSLVASWQLIRRQRLPHLHTFVCHQLEMPSDGPVAEQKEFPRWAELVRRLLPEHSLLFRALHATTTQHTRSSRTARRDAPQRKPSHDKEARLLDAYQPASCVPSTSAADPADANQLACRYSCCLLLLPQASEARCYCCCSSQQCYDNL